MYVGVWFTLSSTGSFCECNTILSFVSYIVYYWCSILEWNWSNGKNILSALWILITGCFITRVSVATLCTYVFSVGGGLNGLIAIYYLIIYVKNYCEQPLKHVDMRLHSNSPLDKTCMVLPGRERLVSLSDRAHLPYTEAVFREAMRIFPVLPMAFPRATSCDVEIRKFLNPKNGGSQ